MVCSSRANTPRAFVSLACVAVAWVAGGCARTASPAQASSALAVRTQPDIRTMVDDGTTGLAVGRFHYVGHWESVSGRADGRSLGTSTRSYHRSDIASISFSGTQIRLYGVLGPKGGDAFVSVDGSRGARHVNFRAPSIETNVLVYTSPVLDSSVHTLTVFVTGRNVAESPGGFVNVDSAVISAVPRGT